MRASVGDRVCVRGHSVGAAEQHRTTGLAGVFGTGLGVAARPGARVHREHRGPVSRPVGEEQVAHRLGVDPAAQARSRAAARTARSRTRCASSTRATARHAVGSEATGPNSLPWSRSPARWVNASPPSAIVTARSASTRPGACRVGNARYVSSSTSVHPAASPVSTVNSRSSSVPARDTNPVPSALTLTRLDRRLLFTYGVPSGSGPVDSQQAHFPLPDRHFRTFTACVTDGRAKDRG